MLKLDEFVYPRILWIFNMLTYMANSQDRNIWSSVLQIHLTAELFSLPEYFMEASVSENTFGKLQKPNEERLSRRKE